ncbi:uncharacterized protein LOC121780100 [Salvia splendens]|uniref:uncharacterized protein LOC121780100 n=1 Tax=Salvia splendens TaxID=180675 RepID=UPI001C26E89D|nr:uncharacterized protein LOC121780100 [Salvia splendens]
MKDIYICNLITREYTELSYPELVNFPNLVLQFGFGVSKISGQYKVVLINGDTGSNSHYVYTLGTGTWRRVKAGASSGFNLWECFSIFSLPPMGIRHGELSVLRDCMCYSYCAHNNDEIVIWMMKEYQVDESWSIEYKMSTTCLDLSLRKHCISVEALKLFKDGDVLMLLDSSILVYYSNKTRTLEEVNVLKDADAKKGYALIFNPSLLPLKSLGFENVISF